MLCPGIVDLFKFVDINQQRREHCSRPGSVQDFAFEDGWQETAVQQTGQDINPHLVSRHFVKQFAQKRDDLRERITHSLQEFIPLRFITQTLP